MKLLHTADWHLGQKFLYNDREAEHRLALDWLLDLIKTEAIEAVIVAGDIFDVQNPPNYARSLYYNFLTKLLNTSCRHVIIVGGNHDSPAMLNAPRELLKALNVHVVGCASEQLEDDIFELKDQDGNLEAVIAAVPFLRDQDIRRSISGESDLERIERIKLGIYNYYQKAGELVIPYQKMNVPIIATGHLYAKGAHASSNDQNNIYIGNRENISAEQFPSVFDYIALGHIHCPQKLGGLEHVRYSGSLIPLKFKETKDPKSVSIVQFNHKTIKDIKLVSVPEFRRLKTVEGDLETIKKSLERFAAKDRELTPWMEIIVQTDTIIPNLDTELRAFTKDMELEVLKIKVLRQHHALDQQIPDVELEDLQPLEVFKKKCESSGKSPEDMKTLIATFTELENWMTERDEA